MLNMESNGQAKLAAALDECKKGSIRGQKMASASRKRLFEALDEGRKALVKERAELKKSSLKADDVNKTVNQYFQDIEAKIDELKTQTDKELKMHAENRQVFSITLFGETTAGKSTFMETLIKGDGSSIGNGSQATTRNVRQYEWNGLTINDVPGFGATSNGQQGRMADEQKAIDCAKKGDLIIFLLQDNNPKPYEAEFMADVIKLGKPVLCIINVKQGISNGQNINLIKKRINRKFDQKRLDAIVMQFRQFGAKGCHQDWRKIKFIPAHLKAAFLSERPEWSAVSKELYDVSRFDNVVKEIINLVSSQGAFFRQKNYYDSYFTQTYGIERQLLAQVEGFTAIVKTYASKKQKLVRWRKQYEQNGLSKIKSFVDQVHGDLENEISSFAEDNYDNEDAGEDWGRLVQRKGIDQQASSVLESLGQDLQNEINQISRELANEMKFQSKISMRSHASGEGINDYKRWAGWATAGASALAAAFLSGGIAIAVGVIGGIITWLFGSKEKKIRKARRKMERQLSEATDQMTSQLETEMKSEFTKQLLNNLDRIIADVDSMENSIHTISQLLSSIGWELNERVLNMNKNLMIDAFCYEGLDREQAKTDFGKMLAARIPTGEWQLLVPGIRGFQASLKKNIEALMQIKMEIMPKKETVKGIIAQSIKVSEADIRIVSGTRTAYVRRNPGIKRAWKKRMELAQQLSGLFVKEAAAK